MLSNARKVSKLLVLKDLGIFAKTYFFKKCLRMRQGYIFSILTPPGGENGQGEKNDEISSWRKGVKEKRETGKGKREKKKERRKGRKSGEKVIF